METAQTLREKAARFIRFSHWVSNPKDIATFEALAAEANQAAAEREEAAEAKRLAEPLARVI